VIRTALGVAALAVALLGATTAGAQESAASTGRYEVAVGIRMTGARGLGGVDAKEAGAGGGPYTLFTTNTRLAALTGLEGRIGVGLWRSLQVEGAASYGTSELQTSIGGDVEGFAPVTATEPTKQLVVEAALVAHLVPRTHRVVPFVAGGGGYVRQLFSAQTLAQTGRSYFAGGGVDVILERSTRRAAKAAGIRVDVRAVVHTGGVTTSGRRSVAPSLGTSFFFRF
jgi:hypothetical protein